MSSTITVAASAAPAADSGVAAASASSSSSGPAKGLFLRVKRRRNEAALETLVVTSERAEKRAALVDLRQSFAGTKVSDASGAGSGANAALFKSRAAAAPPASATQRVFRLLTSTAAPKEKHGSEAAIMARVATMRARVGAAGASATAASVHPALTPTASDVHADHLLAQQLSTGQKRQLRLDANREKLAALQQSHLTPAAVSADLVHDSAELQLQIVDVALSAPGRAAPAKMRTTFEPAPLTPAEARVAQREVARAQRTAIEGSSHHNVSSHASGGAAGASGSSLLVDPFEAARQFTQAMTTIKQMPGDRAQMDAYKGLLEDYLSTLPPSAAESVAANNAKQTSQATATTNTSTTSTSTNSTYVDTRPSTNRIAPKIPLRRKKKPTEPAQMAEDTLPAGLEPVPQASHLPTAGGLPYNPNTLVTATGTSLHRLGQTNDATDDAAVDAAADADADDEYVYDVYHLPDEGSASVDDDEYKSRYTGASSAYVVLKDGLMSWVGGGDELVNEADEADDDEAACADDDDENELSDYPEDEDSSAGEDDGLEEMDPEEYRRYRTDYGDEPSLDVWKMQPHQSAQSMLHFKKAAPAAHGFLAQPRDTVDLDDEDDEDVRDVRRMMAAGARDDLSSDEDESCDPRLRPDEAQDDEEYTDIIDAEEDMDYARDEADDDDE